MADALVSGASGTPVWVQVPSSAPSVSNPDQILVTSSLIRIYFLSIAGVNDENNGH